MIHGASQILGASPTCISTGAWGDVGERRYRSDDEFRYTRPRSMLRTSLLRISLLRIVSVHSLSLR